MITALCHGKLSRELEGSEDLLTSAVFGRLGYLAPHEGLIPFLQSARYADKTPLLPPDIRIAGVEYDFWPWWQFDDCRGAEPDLVIDLTTTEGDRYKVLIEAKFRSGKSSDADFVEPVPADQLAREWDNLTRCSERDQAVPLLIYLTADFAIPIDDLTASEREFGEKRCDSAFPFRAAWLSWRHLGFALRNRDSAVARDILALVNRLDLTFFDGVRTPHVSDWAWRFYQLVTPFSLDIPRLEKWTWTFQK